MESEQKINYALCLPDDHKERISQMLKDELNKQNSFIHLKDKNDVVMKFYYQGDIMYAERADGEKTIVQTVLSTTEATAAQKKHRPFKEYIEERIKADFPDKSNEEVQQDADILNEANESIKNLIKTGVAPSVARRIIQMVLDCETEAKSPEDIAELIKKEVQEADEKKD